MQRQNPIGYYVAQQPTPFTLHPEDVNDPNWIETIAAPQRFLKFYLFLSMQHYIGNIDSKFIQNSSQTLAVTNNHRSVYINALRSSQHSFYPLSKLIFFLNTTQTKSTSHDSTCSLLIWGRKSFFQSIWSGSLVYFRQSIDGIDPYTLNEF